MIRVSSTGQYLLHMLCKCNVPMSILKNVVSIFPEGIYISIYVCMLNYIYLLMFYVRVFMFMSMSMHVCLYAYIYVYIK
jgi:hypothetical protein